MGSSEPPTTKSRRYAPMSKDVGACVAGLGVVTAAPGPVGASDGTCSDRGAPTIPGRPRKTRPPGPMGEGVVVCPAARVVPGAAGLGPAGRAVKLLAAVGPRTAPGSAWGAAGL